MLDTNFSLPLTKGHALGATILEMRLEYMEYTNKNIYFSKVSDSLEYIFIIIYHHLMHCVCVFVRQMPEFIVYSAPFSVGDLKLVIKGAILGGRTVQHLTSRQNGYPSRCSFKDVTIGPQGLYVMQVVSCVDSRVVLQSEPITVIPPPMRNSEIGDVFDDLDKMLQF